MIYNLIATLLEYGLKKNLIKEEDRVYFQNKLIEFLKLDDYKEAEPLDYSLEQLMDAFDDYAVEQGWIGNSVTERDLLILDSSLYSLIVQATSLRNSTIDIIKIESLPQTTSITMSVSIVTTSVNIDVTVI